MPRAPGSAVVQAELEAAAAVRTAVEKDWAAMSLRELIAHIIVRHHGISLELPRLRARLDRASRHGERDGAPLTRCTLCTVICTPIWTATCTRKR